MKPIVRLKADETRLTNLEMNLKKIIIMVSLVLLLAGCTPSVPSSILEDGLVTRFMSVSNVTKVYVDKTVGSDGVFPPEIVISNVNYGDEMSTWTDNIPDLGIVKGEPLSVYIYNRTGEEVTYNISSRISDKILKDDDGNEYQPSIAAVFWVELSDEVVVVPPETVAAVSIRMLIPEKNKGYTLPDKWAFQIYVKPIESGNIQRAYLQNWLIKMK